MSLLVIVIYYDPYGKKKGRKKNNREKNKGIEKEPSPPYSNQRICEEISLFYPYLTIQKEEEENFFFFFFFFFHFFCTTSIFRMAV